MNKSGETAVANENIEVVNQKPPVQTPVQEQKTLTAQEQLDEYISNAPPPLRPVLIQGIRAFQEEKSQLIGVILGNKKNRFKKEMLETKEDIDELRALAALAAETPVNNGGQPPSGGRWFGAEGSAAVTNAAEPVTQEALASPVLNFSKEDRKRKGAKKEEVA
jgi:hypothetical protein